MKFLAEINVMPLKALLDPQGKVVAQSLKKLNLSGTGDVRIGKHITIEIDAENEKKASEITEDACKKLLCNPIMEFYEFKIKPL